MDEYIERKAAIRALTLHDCDSAGAKMAICDLPAADVAPVRHGEWIVCGDGNNVPWMCSHCGKTITRKFKMMYGKYCPNCGAKMDKEDSQCDT